MRLISNLFHQIRFFCLSLAISIFSWPGYSVAQGIEKPKETWHTRDLIKDKVFGISLEQTYETLLQGKKVNPVIVAVIDGSFDFSHNALKPLLWINSEEIAGNRIDDDKNGFIDDVHGWNSMPAPSKELSHGSHVGGIVASIAKENVSLMNLCVLPDDDTDELDRDDASAIRYAVDHGARVINISYEKFSSPEKKLVDEAVKYAMSKDALIVRAAGNAEVAKNMDVEVNFPNKVYADGSGVAQAWITVGASGPKDDETLVWPHSNYGKNTVDVFASGVDIYSAVEGNKYECHSGTSMASPVVTGLAALIRAHYPELTAIQVKDIIVNSVLKRDVLKDKCVSGGVVNAYRAFEMAAKYKQAVKK